MNCRHIIFNGSVFNHKGSLHRSSTISVNSEDSLVRKLSRLITNPSLLSKMKERSKKFGKEAIVSIMSTYQSDHLLKSGINKHTLSLVPLLIFLSQ